MPYHLTCRCGRMLVIPESQREATICCPRCGQQLTMSPDPPVPAPPKLPPVPAPLPEEPRSGDSVPGQSSRRSGLAVDRRHRQSVTFIAVALVLVVAVSLLPLYLNLWQAFAQETSLSWGRWASVLLGLGSLQIAYAIYLVQLPDWSSAWVVSAVTLCIASAYAAVVGVCLLGRQPNALLQWLELDANRFSATEEAGWCFIILLLTALFSYFTGRFGARWHAAAQQPLAPTSSPRG